MTDNTSDSNTPIENIPPTPFAGRQAVFERIQQYLIDPADRHALLFIGRKSVGKSAILLQCQHILGENVIGCYLPLADKTFKGESNWLSYLIEQTNFALERHNLNITRLPSLPDEDNTNNEQATDDFLNDLYLPELSKLIRPHRRLVWLMDDAEYFIHAIGTGKLPDNTIGYLTNLLESHLQLGIVMMLEEDNESQVVALSPLVDVNQVQRLHPLGADETQTLMTRFSDHLSTSAQQHIYDLTDGHPLLLQAIGKGLQTIYTSPITESDIDTFIEDVYSQAHDMYLGIWQNTLSQSERLVLTAISDLLYDDPLANLTAQRIESWLLETDYPMDITSINAGIRGLEYRDLVVGSTSDGIRIRAKLFQRWLIENARMDKPATWHTRPNHDDTPVRLDRRTLAIIGIVIIVVIIFVAMLQQSNSSSTPSAHPTVTLESQ